MSSPFKKLKKLALSSRKSLLYGTSFQAKLSPLAYGQLCQQPFVQWKLCIIAGLLVWSSKLDEISYGLEVVFFFAIFWLKKLSYKKCLELLVVVVMTS